MLCVNPPFCKPRKSREAPVAGAGPAGEVEEGAEELLRGESVRLRDALEARGERVAVPRDELVEEEVADEQFEDVMDFYEAAEVDEAARLKLIDDFLEEQYAFFSMPFFFVSTFVFVLKFLILKTFWQH